MDAFVGGESANPSGHSGVSTPEIPETRGFVRSCLLRGKRRQATPGS